MSTGMNEKASVLFLSPFQSVCLSSCLSASFSFVSQLSCSPPPPLSVSHSANVDICSTRKPPSTYMHHSHLHPLPHTQLNIQQPQSHTHLAITWHHLIHITPTIQVPFDQSQHPTTASRPIISSHTTADLPTDPSWSDRLLTANHQSRPTLGFSLIVSSLTSPSSRPT